MKKILLICLVLLICYIGLLGLLQADQEDSFALPATASAGEEENTTLSSPLPEADSIQQADEPLLADALPDRPLNPAGNGEADPAPQDTPLAPPAPEVSPEAPVMALTFDDGPSKDYTPQLLDILAERNIKVTFFVVGNRVQQHPDIIKRAYAEGHSIAIHTYDHIDQLTKLTQAGIDAQVQVTGEIIAGILGTSPPSMLRPPYGAIDPETALKTGKINMLWSIDPRDWDVRDVDVIYDHVMEHKEDGAVIIMHDIFETSVQAAAKLLDTLLAEGWRFVTLEELYAEKGVELEVGGIYRYPGYYTAPALTE